MLKKKCIVRYPLGSIPVFSDSMPLVLRRVLANRGVTDLKDISYELDHLLSFKDLLNIDKAIDLLCGAFEKQMRILIIGDFDADGATSTALAVSVLRALGAKQVMYVVPDRFKYGYGLTPEIVDVAAQYKPDIIITVDNGISSLEGVMRANAYGIQVLITDHHLPGREMPPASVIINPNQPGDSFKSKNLAGVGVIFYLMWGLRNRLQVNGWFAQHNTIPPNLADFLDLVALGTVADLVPLDYNNRILVHQGLKRIRAAKRPGIQALLEVAHRNPKTIVASDLGFVVAPRLNAAGRLEDMSLGIECLLTDSLQKAREIVQRLDALNAERKSIEADMQQQADHMLIDFNACREIGDVYQTALEEGGPWSICLYGEDWHPGVIGILASRLKERFHLPVIVFAKSNEPGMLKGSARSISGLHIRDALDLLATRYPGLINKFGGHAQAAGLQIALKDFEKFREAFGQVVAERLSPECLTDRLMSDGELLGEDFSLNMAYLFRDTTPWGQHFPEPLFDGRFKVLDQRLVGEKHLKLSLMSGNCFRPLSAIAFNIDLAKWPNQTCDYIQVAYRLDMNEYQGQQSLQLIVEYLEVA